MRAREVHQFINLDKLHPGLATLPYKVTTTCTIKMNKTVSSLCMRDFAQLNVREPALNDGDRARGAKLSEECYRETLTSRNGRETVGFDRYASRLFVTVKKLFVSTVTLVSR